MRRTRYKEILEVIAFLEWLVSKIRKEIQRATAAGESQVVLLQRLEEAQAELQEKQGIIEAYADFKNKLSGMDAELFEKYYIDGKILDTVAKEMGYTDGHIRKKHAALLKRIRMYQALQAKGMV
jgi:DNA-directed RNA polymerase specialized sigma subunit